LVRHDRCGLDALIVGAPVDDGLLDLFAVEVFGYSALGEGGYFGVGGEAEADVLVDGEGVDEAELIFREEVGEAKLLFEADEAVLVLEGVAAEDSSHDEKHDRHDDPPEVHVGEAGPAVDGGVDREDQVQQQHGQDEEVKRRVESRVVLERLWLSHSSDDRAVFVSLRIGETIGAVFPGKTASKFILPRTPTGKLLPLLLGEIVCIRVR